jgi:hypothetical protein
VTTGSTPPGWYDDPENRGRLRYWDGSQWTDHRAPAGRIPVAPSVYHVSPLDLYREGADLTKMLDPYQQEQFKQHSLSRFPSWLVVVLHFLTLGLFTLIYQGLKFSDMPLVKHDDFRAGKGIGFMFIPFFNLYWVFRYALSMTDRLNFQFRLRGQPPRVSRGLALTSAIGWVIPYVQFISFLILMPIVSGQWQSAANWLADARLQEINSAPPAPPPLQPATPAAPASPTPPAGA